MSKFYVSDSNETYTLVISRETKKEAALEFAKRFKDKEKRLGNYINVSEGPGFSSDVVDCSLAIFDLYELYRELGEGSDGLFT